MIKFATRQLIEPCTYLFVSYIGIIDKGSFQLLLNVQICYHSAIYLVWFFAYQRSILIVDVDRFIFCFIVYFINYTITHDSTEFFFSTKRWYFYAFDWSPSFIDSKTRWGISDTLYTAFISILWCIRRRGQWGKRDMVHSQY